MSRGLIASLAICISWLAEPGQAEILFSGEKKLNNFVSELLEVSSIEESDKTFEVTRSNDGWILISLVCQGSGTISVALDKKPEAQIVPYEAGGARREAMRYISQGEHTIQVKRNGNIRIQKLTVRALPELIHCGLGFNPEIKSYGLYDMAFLQKDILPNVTTLIVPNNIKLSETVIDDWHRRGKKFIAEVGVNSEARTAWDHARFWSGFYEKAPFLDGIIINEFIVNRPVAEWVEAMTPERRTRMEQERQQYEAYGEALKIMGGDDRYQDKMVYAYVGGSGKKLNQEIIGTNFIRTIIDSGYRVALERYLHEMSSEEGSKNALQTFVDGIADWTAKEPKVKKQMVIAFGLFSMPPGGINKQPNVDYHVWMDQQMNIVANHPMMAGLAGIEWWTSILADEETVRFVGKLYRHYAIDGQKEMLTRDPLFLTHIRNADFENGTQGWTLHAAEDGTIAVKSFPRYGRIQGRFMGLGRPANPEHIGDTFLWMKRSAKAPNTFSQTIQDLEPGRPYSMKMFICDYHDLVIPKAKKVEEAKAMVRVVIQGVDVDAKKSFSETYSSNPEPNIPVCITYYWTVFRPRTTTAELTVSDWLTDQEPGTPFGQEQAFNFLEIQPYHE